MADTVTLETTAVEDLSNKRTYLPIELYLPEELRETEFFQAISILINYTENNLSGFSNEKYAEIEQAYRDIGFKYKNIMALSEDALRAQLKENGFEAILDMLDMPLEQLQMFVLYLPLFKALKGTDIGFNQILKLLSFDYELTSWLDDPVNLEDFTYELTLITFLNVGFGADIVRRLSNFSRSYVYPVLKRATIKAMYRSLAPAVYARPVMKKQIVVRCFEVPDILEQMYIPVPVYPKVYKRITTRCFDEIGVPEPQEIPDEDGSEP